MLLYNTCGNTRNMVCVMDKVFSEKINMLKALAIILVVSGHLEFSVFGMFPPYSFQLALFFFISGMLFKEKYIDDVSTYFVKRIKSLLVPYFCYEVFYLMITSILAKYSGHFLGDTPSLKTFFVTPFLNGHQLLLCAPLWFVPQLFMTLIVFLYLMRLLRKIPDKYGKLAFFAVLGFGAIPFIKYFGNTPITLVIMRTMFSLFFVYLGYFYVKYIRENYNIYTPKWFGCIILFQSFLWLFNRDFTPEHGIGLSYVLVWGRFDQQIIVPILTALTGIWVSLFTIKILYPFFKDVKLIDDIGSATYHIMANHVFVMYLITMFLCRIHGVTMDLGNSDKIYAIYNPVQTTYFYFVIVMLITTYFGKFQRFIGKYIKGCFRRSL